MRGQSKTARALTSAVLSIVASVGTLLTTETAVAAPTTSMFSVPLSEVIRCDERVAVTGAFDFTAHVTETASGSVLATLRFTPNHVVGIGLKSGDAYRLVGASMEVTLEGEPVFSTTFVHHGVLVGGDPGAEFPLSIVFHATVTKKHQVTVSVDRSECF